MIHPLFAFLILAIQSPTATSNILAPIFDKACKEVECGKGDCKPTQNNESSFPFQCECHPGWKQPLSSLSFLPCVLPNCTLNKSCSRAPASSSQKQQNQTDGSIFDPCHGVNICRGGTCNKTSKFSYACSCSEGYYNLLNRTSFPCFRQCEFAADCENLGISVYKSAPPPPDNNSNQGALHRHQNLHLVTALVMVIDVILKTVSVGEFL
ncbi:hypothetical protein Ancab_013300 [Ancistrocladus abbreviatus]